METRTGRRAGALPPPSRADLPGGRRPERDRAQPPGQPAGNAPGPDQLGDRLVGRRHSRRPSRRYWARPARCRPQLRSGCDGAWAWRSWRVDGGQVWQVRHVRPLGFLRRVRPAKHPGPQHLGSCGRVAGRSLRPGDRRCRPRPAAAGVPQDAMIQLKVDPAKLPKAEESQGPDVSRHTGRGGRRHVDPPGLSRVVSRCCERDGHGGHWRRTSGSGSSGGPGPRPGGRGRAAWPDRTGTRAGQPPSRGTTASRGRRAGTNGRCPRARAKRPARWRRSTRMIAIPP